MSPYTVAALVLAVEGLALGVAALPGILRDLGDMDRENVRTVQPGELPGQRPDPRETTRTATRVTTREAAPWERV